MDRIKGASAYRRHRFTDTKGNLIPLESVAHAPKALVTSLLNKFFGYRPELPWISYRAIGELDRLIQRDWKAVEFGSGMSTLWFSKRCSFLHSIESDSQWYERVRIQLAKHQVNNVKYEYRDRPQYSSLSDYPDGFFDFAMIDGILRDECTRSAISKIRRGGWIYIDNSDTDTHLPKGEMREAELILSKAIQERGGILTYFVDFAPTQFFVNQGCLAQL